MVTLGPQSWLTRGLLGIFCPLDRIVAKLVVPRVQVHEDLLQLNHMLACFSFHKSLIIRLTFLTERKELCLLKGKLLLFFKLFFS